MGLSPPVEGLGASLSFEQQKELFVLGLGLCMILETEKLLSLEKG